MQLKYLDFDHSEDTEGVGTFEAMASVGPSQRQAVRTELAQVLAWAHRRFPLGRGPIDEGRDWDVDMQDVTEVSTVEQLDYDSQRGVFTVHVEPAGAPRHTVTLSLTGTEAFCQAFREQFLREA